MNVAIIFAGGVGKRMKNSNAPKQFLKVNNKEILVYTIEKFQNCDQIDGIVLVVLSEYIDFCKMLCEKYCFTKIKSVVCGGKTGQESIYNGLNEANNIYNGDSVVLINDGVRPMITDKDIINAIEITKSKGNAIPITKAVETIAINSKDGELGKIMERQNVVCAKAPQAFVLKEILEIHKKAKEDNLNFIDSASMMQYYGKKLYTFECGYDNIKITTPIDYYLFKGLVEREQNDNE